MLIEIVKDKKAYEAERIDAAHALEDFDDAETLNTLFAICQDPQEDVVLISLCGESIGNVWLRNKHFDLEKYHSLLPAAQREIDSVINDP